MSYTHWLISTHRWKSWPAGYIHIGIHTDGNLGQQDTYTLVSTQMEDLGQQVYTHWCQHIDGRSWSAGHTHNGISTQMEDLSKQVIHTLVSTHRSKLLVSRSHIHWFNTKMEGLGQQVLQCINTQVEDTGQQIDGINKQMEDTGQQVIYTMTTHRQKNLVSKKYT